MTESESLIYGMLMKHSNLDKLVQSGLTDLVLDDLWFKCIECKDQHHCDAMILLGCSLGADGKLKPTIAAQPVRQFFTPIPRGIAGISDELAAHDGIALRCIECASSLWDIEIELPTGDTPEGWRTQ